MAPTLAAAADDGIERRGGIAPVATRCIYPWGVYSEGAVDPHRKSHHKEKRVS
jgi:hypothetical protein